MASEWYTCRYGGQRAGPFSSRQLKERAVTGQLGPQDLIWKEGMKGWIEARQLPGLFQEAAVEPPPPSVPIHGPPSARPWPPRGPVVVGRGGRSNKQKANQGIEPDQSLSTALLSQRRSGANKPLLGTLGPSRLSRLSGLLAPTPESYPVRPQDQAFGLQS
jgi:hypothetical protein